MRKKLTCRPGDARRKRKRFEGSGDHDQHSRSYATRAGTSIDLSVSDETSLQLNYHANAFRLQVDPHAATPNEECNRTGVHTPETATSVAFQCTANVSEDLYLHSSNNNESTRDMSAMLALDANENGHDPLWTTQFFDATSPLLWTYLEEIMPTGINETLLQTIERSGADTDRLLGEAPPGTIGIPNYTHEYNTTAATAPGDIATGISEKPTSMSGLSFPATVPTDTETLLCENFCHLNAISPTAYEQSKRYFAHLQGSQITTFPTIQKFHSFAELYFEHFDQSFPFVHPRQLEQENASWLLLVAVVSIGAQYSSISNAETYVKSFQALLERILRDHVMNYIPVLSIT